MSVILWQHGTDSDHIREAVERVTDSKQLEIFSDIYSLKQRLRKPGTASSVVVLVAPSREDLDEAASLRNILSDQKVIMVLPNRDKDTIALGHSMSPRYLTYVDSDPQDMAAVLSRLVKFTSHRNSLNSFRMTHSEY